MSKTRKRISVTIMFVIMLAFSLSMTIFSGAQAAGAPPEIVGGGTLIGSKMADNYTKLLLPVEQITTKTASSEQAGYGFGNAFDNNASTKWEAKWDTLNVPVIIDLVFKFDRVKTLTGFRYEVRRDNNIAGAPKDYTISISTDGTTYTKVEGLDQVALPYKLGIHTIDFGKEVSSQHMKVTFNKAYTALTQLDFIYVPNSVAEIDRLTDEIATIRSAASVSLALEKGKYLGTFVDAFDTGLTTAVALPVSSDLEIGVKAKTLYNMAIEFKRAIITDTDVLATLVTNAKMLSNAAVAGDKPLTWAQADMDAFAEIVADAQELVKAPLATYGAVYDMESTLTRENVDFKAASTKPEISTTNVFTGKDTDLSNLMDGTTEKRFSVDPNNSKNYGEQAKIVFDYKQETRFVNAQFKAWWPDSQGVPKIMLEYFDGAEFKPIVSPTVTDGIYTIKWVGNSGKSDTKTVEFTAVDTTKVRLTILEKATSSAIVIDELELGIAVDPDKISVVLEASNMQIYEMQRAQLNVTVLPFYASNKNILWSSSNENLATVSEDGELRTFAALDENSTVTITATSEFSPTKKAVCEVTVLKKAITDDEKESLQNMINQEKTFCGSALATNYEADAKEEFLAAIALLQTRLDVCANLGEYRSIMTALTTARNVFNSKNLLRAAAVEQLIDRVAGEGHSKNFIIETITADLESGMDVFELDWSIEEGKPIIRGNNSVAISTAFNYYLKYYCYQNFPYTGEFNITMPEIYPVVTKSLRNVFPTQYRHYFNVNCEYKYSAVNYSEQDWRNRMDWLALNGYNMYLFDFDFKTVWLDIAKSGKLGKGFDQASRDELMKAQIEYTPEYGNHQLTEASVEKASELGKKVMQMGFDLGIDPEIRPFYGALPFMFKNNHNDYYGSAFKSSFEVDLPNTIFDGIQVYQAARWVGIPQGVAVSPYIFNSASGKAEITPQSKLAFDTLSDLYYDHYMELFGFNKNGKTLKYVFKDLVEEHGFVINNKAYPKEMLSYLEEGIQKKFSGAKWIVSSWTIQEWELDYFSKENTLVLDLNCDSAGKNGSTQEFWGTEWMFSVLNNYGGNQGIGSDLQGISDKMFNLRDKSKYLKGVGISPEGSDTDPLYYEFIVEHSWRNERVDVTEWMRQYSMRRYGIENYYAAKMEIDAVYKTLQATAYSVVPKGYPYNSYIVALPKIRGAATRPNATVDVKYDEKQLITVWENMLAAAAKMPNINERFVYDLVDFSRQILGNVARPIYLAIAPAYVAGNIDLAIAKTAEMAQLCDDMDEVLNTCYSFLAGMRLEGARSRGEGKADSDYFEKTERTFWTYWKGDAVNSDNQIWSVFEYGNKHLGGFVKEYYSKRWRAMEDQLKIVKALPTLPDIATFESQYQNKAQKTALHNISKDWINSASDDTRKLPTTTVGDPIDVSKKMLAKYTPKFVEYYTLDTTVNKTELTNSLASLVAEKEPGFDEDCWLRYEDAVANATAVIAKADASKQEVLRSNEYLVNTYNELLASSGQINKTALLNKYSTCIKVELDKYTYDTVEVFEKALISAKTIIDKSDATQEEINIALAALTSAHEGLREEEIIVIPPPDKTQLVAKYETYLNERAASYTAESFAKFNEKLVAAKAVIDNADAVLADVTKAINDLEDAYKALEKPTEEGKKGCSGFVDMGGIDSLGILLGIMVAGLSLTVIANRKKDTTKKQ